MDDRKTYIGGSDVAPILGLSAYRGPLETWKKKREGETSGGSALLRAGLHMESFILREYEATGAVLRLGHVTPDGREIVAQQTARHPRFPFMGATVDTFADRDGVRLVVDAKMSRKAIDSGDADTIPFDWQLQLHHYGWICGIDRAEIAICRVGADFSVVAVPLALDLGWYAAAVVPRLVDFWRCVETGEEPKPAAFTERDAPPALPPDAERWALEYAAASAAIKAAESRKEDAKSELIRIVDAAGRPRYATAGEARVSAWVQAGRETIDTKALRADLPEVAEKYTRRGEASIQVRVAMKGEKL